MSHQILNSDLNVFMGKKHGNQRAASGKRIFESRSKGGRCGVLASTRQGFRGDEGLAMLLPGRLSFHYLFEGLAASRICCGARGSFLKDLNSGAFLA